MAISPTVSGMQGASPGSGRATLVKQMLYSYTDKHALVIASFLSDNRCVLTFLIQQSNSMPVKPGSQGCAHISWGQADVLKQHLHTYQRPLMQQRRDPCHQQRCNLCHQQALHRPHLHDMRSTAQAVDLFMYMAVNSPGHESMCIAA